MNVLGKVVVADILEALDVFLPEGSTLKADDLIAFDDVLVNDDDARDELDDDEPETVELHDQFNQTEVMDLAAAIRRGDTKESELLFDRLIAADDTVAHWVQQGRYSRKARVAQVEGLREAA